MIKHANTNNKHTHNNNHNNTINDNNDNTYNSTETFSGCCGCGNAWLRGLVHDTYY